MIRGRGNEKRRDEMTCGERWENHSFEYSTVLEY